MQNKNKNKIDAPLSESSVSYKLSEIQKRCSKLLEEPEGMTELHLIESEAYTNGTDPYELQTDPYNLKR